MKSKPGSIERASTTFDVVRWRTMPSPAAVVPALEEIMLEASGRTFKPDPERDAFVERWLGRFLAHDPDKVFLLLARSPGEAPVLAGYLVGATDNPARAKRFADLSYFRDFANQCDRFPAHLHINLAPTYRGGGLGRRLIEAFADHARGLGSPGVHVVTAADARNITFYSRCGFVPVGRSLWNRRSIVMLGRTLLGDAP